jgi:hypothetical protein
MQTKDTTPYIIYERAKQGAMRIVTIEFNEKGHAYVAGIFEGSDLDFLWKFWA